jgi:hypothetical protein
MNDADIFVPRLADGTPDPCFDLKAIQGQARMNEIFTVGEEWSPAHTAKWLSAAQSAANIPITAVAHGLNTGDTIATACAHRYHWLVRFAAWMTCTELYAPPPRQFQVTNTASSAQFEVEEQDAHE